MVEKEEEEVYAYTAARTTTMDEPRGVTDHCAVSYGKYRSVRAHGGNTGKHGRRAIRTRSVEDYACCALVLNRR